MTAAVATPDQQAQVAALSRSQASSQSKPSIRLYFFTALSVIGCLLALANVAAAATPSGQDQYIEQIPSGGGDDGDDGGDGDGEQADTGLTGVDADGDGTVSEEEVTKAAKKKKSAKKDGSEEGSTGASGAVAGSSKTPTPPAAESVATSAKFGPVSRSTALIIGALALVGGLGFAVFGGGGASILGGGGSAASVGANPPPPSQ